MNPPAETETIRLLPARQAFVVQVSVEADVAQGHWVGRVEHVVPGEARHFQTLHALLDFMAHVLTSASQRPPAMPEADAGEGVVCQVE